MGISSLEIILDQKMKQSGEKGTYVSQYEYECSYIKFSPGLKWSGEENAESGSVNLWCSSTPSPRGLLHWPVKRRRY